MLIVIGVILAIVVIFALLKPLANLAGEMIGLIIAGAVIIGVIALCVVFPPLIIVAVVLGIIFSQKGKQKS